MPKLDNLDIEVIRGLAENRMNVTETARTIHLHRNTVRARIERVKKKTGIDPTDFYGLCKLLMLAGQAKYIESLDVVEVRCEECLYRSQYPDENGRYLCGGIQTEDGDLAVKVMPGFYCGYGEKRGKNA